MIDGARGPVRAAEAQLRRLHPGEDGVDAAVAWARGVLDQHGLDPAETPLRALRRLRREDRRLRLVTARYLVERAAGRDPSARHRPRSPFLR